VYRSRGRNLISGANAGISRVLRIAGRLTTDIDELVRLHIVVDGDTQVSRIPRRLLAAGLYLRLKAEYPYMSDSTANRMVLFSYIARWFKDHRKNFATLRDADQVAIQNMVVAAYYIPVDLELVHAALPHTTVSKDAVGVVGYLGTTTLPYG
jgi:hypothetical protein